MYFRSAFLCAFILMLAPSAVHALTLKELQRYDKNGNGKLDAEKPKSYPWLSELDVYNAHKDDPVLAKYDLNTNGILDPGEFQKLSADIKKRYAAGRPPPPKGDLTDEEKFARGKGAFEAANGGIPLQDLVEAPKKLPDECNPDQQLYVRKDRLDTFLYGITPRSKAQGASISYTDDLGASQRSLTVNGVVAYVPWRAPCLPRPPGYTIDDPYLSAYAFAPWISAHGTFNEPVKKNEKNDLKTGFDAQFTIFGGSILDYQAFTVSPYAQTDFRGDARVAGITGFWEPYRYAIRLGGSPTLFSEYVDWYWQLRLEGDIKQVDKVGFTDLTLGHYGWLGGTLRIHAFLFPTSTLVPEFLRNRLHATATFKAYEDAYSSARISWYSAELAYNIVEDGSASISIEYDRGTVKDTLEWVKQYLIKLNYKY